MTTDNTVGVVSVNAANISHAAVTAHTDGSRTQTRNQTIELSENFYINHSKKSDIKIQVKLNGEGVYLRRETEQQNEVTEQLIQIEDIIGTHCGPRLKKRTRGGLSSCKRISEDDRADDQTTQEGISHKKDASAYLYIYAYVKQECPFRRIRTVRILRFRSSERLEENQKTAELWHKAIQNNKYNSINRSYLMEGMQQQKQLLILLNPKSGSGKGRDLFQKQVAPVLKESEIPYDLQVTTHANFARELIRLRTDLTDRYCGIVVASGDGLFYEVLNGLMERPDWRAVSQLPLGIIPCGSGNGLAKSIAYLYDEPYEPKPILYSTLTCVSGHSALMDIVRIELAKGDKHVEMYSFLSVGWGLIADIDIESERLRSLGAQRFTLWTIRRLINLRSYKGKLSYLPWREEDERKVTAGDQEVPMASTATATLEAQLPEEPALQPQDEQIEKLQEFHDLPSEAFEDDDVFADTMSLGRSSYHTNADSWRSAVSRRTAYYSIAGQSIRSHRSFTNANMLSKIESANAELNAQLPASTIPPLNMPIPNENWHTEEGDFVMVQAAYTTHLASDVFFAPDSRLNDGKIYVVIIRSGVSRPQLMQFLLGLSTGTHFPTEPNEFIQVVPVTAFRIEPSSDDGIMTVDGERVDYGPIQGEVLPGIIKVMVPKAD